MGVFRRKEKWYVNTETGEIVEGKAPHWNGRLGPYPTKEAASQWRIVAQRRNVAADEHDCKWDDKDDDWP